MRSGTPAWGRTPRLRASLARSRGDVTVLAETVGRRARRGCRAGVRDARLSRRRAKARPSPPSLRWDSERGGTADGRLAHAAVARRRGGLAVARQTRRSTAALRAQLAAHRRLVAAGAAGLAPARLAGGRYRQLAGTRGDPRFSGTLAADDLALRSVVDGIELQGGRLRARLDGQRLLIDEFMLHGAGEARTAAARWWRRGEGAWTGGRPAGCGSRRSSRGCAPASAPTASSPCPGSSRRRSMPSGTELTGNAEGRPGAHRVARGERAAARRRRGGARAGGAAHQGAGARDGAGAAAGQPPAEAGGGSGPGRRLPGAGARHRHPAARHAGADGAVDHGAAA